jgi:ribosomal protein S18 acetylase RimI-like enzyme
MPLVLRPAQPTDYPAVVRLMNHAYRGTGPNASWNTESVYLEGDRTSLTALTEEQISHPHSILLVAEGSEPGTIQACVRLEPVGHGTWHLGSLAVDPSQQKSGLGRQLLGAAEQWAADRNATKIHMSVINVRETLIAWYQRRGYQLTGEIEPTETTALGSPAATTSPSSSSKSPSHPKPDRNH